MSAEKSATIIEVSYDTFLKLAGLSAENPETTRPTEEDIVRQARQVIFTLCENMRNGQPRQDAEDFVRDMKDDLALACERCLSRKQAKLHAMGQQKYCPNERTRVKQGDLYRLDKYEQLMLNLLKDKLSSAIPHV